MQVKSLARTFALAVAVIGFLGSPAKADNFLFSFTNNAGNTPGTVTGEIMGLVNNSTGPATEVEILTIPTDPVTFDPNTIPTTWHQVQVNSFTETDGMVTMAEFEANDPSNSLLDSIRYTLVMDTLGIVYSQPSDDLSYPGQGNGYIEQFIVQDDTNINEDQITPLAVPEPSTAFLLSTVMLAAALVARKRIAQGR